MTFYRPRRLGEQLFVEWSPRLRPYHQIRRSDAYPAVYLRVCDVNIHRHEPGGPQRKARYLLFGYLTAKAIYADGYVGEALPSQPGTPACDARKKAQERESERRVGYDHLRARAQRVVRLFGEVGDGYRSKDSADREEPGSQPEPNFAGPHPVDVTQPVAVAACILFGESLAAPWAILTRRRRAGRRSRRTPLCAAPRIVTCGP